MRLIYTLLLDLLCKEKKLFIISAASLLVPLLISFTYTQFVPDIIHVINNDYQISNLQKNFNPDIMVSLPTTDFL